MPHPPHKCIPAVLQIAIVALATCALFLTYANAGERTLHTFVQGNGPAWGGADSSAGLVADSAGNLYGTAPYGGKYGYGVVFEISRNGKGYWTEKVLHNFGNAPGDGISPWGGLIFDFAGNLYGTTIGGGASDEGSVFELTPGRDGNWKEKILCSFSTHESGAAYDPQFGLVMDSAGNLYGETDYGGTYGDGTVFEVSPSAGGGWTESVIYSFGASQADGIDPVSPYLTLDAAGNLYGVTYEGGPYNAGTVFQLSPASGGQWTENILYTFTGGTDGLNPSSTLTLDANGNLYGTTQLYLNGRGTVFEISPTSGGGWSRQTLYSFSGLSGTLGGFPAALTLVFDSAGNLYGVSPIGGTSNYGEVWELSPTTSGDWTPTVLFSFDNTDGAEPLAGVIRDAAGNLYGMTPLGGNLSTNCSHAGCGVAFEVTP